MKYDIEQALSDVKTFLTANLNNQITAINSEKNDSIVLKTVASNAYHLQYPSDRTEMNDPFIIYEEDQPPQVETRGNQVAAKYHVGVSLVLEDNQLDLNIVTRLQRYRRVLTDLFSANWDQIVTNATKTKIEVTEAFSFKHMESGYQGRTVGVVLSFTIEG